MKVHFLGLWDTVSSIGWFWNPQYLQFTANNPIVEAVRHAVALDERRAYFVQIWGHEPNLPTDILQVWLPGVHCDVGGGYVEAQAGVSKVSLKWMVEQAKSFGLAVSSYMEAVILPATDTPQYVAPNPAGPIHESLHGLWWIFEYLPKRIKDPTPGFETRWIIHAGHHRYVAPDSNVHHSAIERKNRVPDYDPPNLPATYTVVQ